MFVGLTEDQAVERVLVRAQGVDRGTAVVDKTVQQAEFGGGSTQLTHTDVNADIGQAALLPSVTQTGLQLLSTGLSVTRQRYREETKIQMFLDRNILKREKNKVYS